APSRPRTVRSRRARIAAARLTSTARWRWARTRTSPPRSCIWPAAATWSGRATRWPRWASISTSSTTAWPTRSACPSSTVAAVSFDGGLVAERAARVDKHEVVGNAVSARLAGRYDFNERLSLRAVYAAGPRLPSIDELDTFARENRDFFHESTSGVDLGVTA